MSFRESRTFLHQPLHPTKKDVEFSEEEEGEYEEEEGENEEEEEREAKVVERGKVQSSVWWFEENIVRPSLSVRVCGSLLVGGLFTYSKKLGLYI